MGIHNRLAQLDKLIEHLENDLEEYDLLNHPDDADGEERAIDSTRRYIVSDLEEARNELSELEMSLEERVSDAGRW